MTTTANRTYKFNRECQDCGDKFGTDRGNAKFCSDTCRKAFNNRRMKRGAELYDFYMMIRYERSATMRDGTLQANVAKGMMEKLGELYREADKTNRGGRKSWFDIREAIHNAEIPLGRSEGVGDGR